MEKYMGLHEGQLVNASLLDAASTVQLRIRWKGMRTRKITTYIRQSAQEQCTPFSEALRECARNTEAMFLIHPTTMHFNGVIALRQRTNLTLIWCDSMQFDGSQAMTTYAQFYHCMEGGVAVNNFTLNRYTHHHYRYARRRLHCHAKLTARTAVYLL